MMRAPGQREFLYGSAPARVSRETLLARLGAHCSSWYTDSNETDLQLHLAWPCGCRAQKGGLVDRLWAYEPCGTHAEPPAAAVGSAS